MQTEFKSTLKSLKKYLELQKLSGINEIFYKYPVALPSDSFSSLRKDILACNKCELYKTRTNVVFGSGNPKADLVFVGEAPGMEEDLQGKPFVGRAGKLLTKIIASIGFKREDVFIANVLKCRPPGNRNPFPAEVLTCEEYLMRQLELIKPKVICALGKFASQSLLKSQTPITRLRGHFHLYGGIKVMPTFHPAYLLRNPEGKRFVWEDMKKIKRELAK